MNLIKLECEDLLLNQFYWKIKEYEFFVHKIEEYFKQKQLEKNQNIIK